MKLAAWLRSLGWILGGLTVILATVGVLAAIAWVKTQQMQAAMEAPPPPEAPIAVGAATAEPISFRRSSVVVGSVLAPRSVRLRTELAGMVTEVPMQAGQVVETGKVLVQMDIRTEQAELRAAEADLKLANSELVRAKELAAANAISIQELDAAEAKVVRTQSEVERLRVMIDRKTIRAPFKARVGLFQLHPGQFLDVGAEITLLEGIDDFVEIDFAVPQHVAEGLKVGEEVRLGVGQGDTPERGWGVAEVIALDAKADAVSRSVTVRAKLSDPPAHLRSNDSVRVGVEYGEPIHALAIPATSVRRGPSGTAVFVITEQKQELRASLRNVLLIGSGDGTHAWVAHGLQPGERVAAEGAFKLRDGALLIEVSTQPSPNSPAGPTENATERRLDSRESSAVSLRSSLRAGQDAGLSPPLWTGTPMAALIEAKI